MMHRHCISICICRFSTDGSFTAADSLYYTISDVGSANTASL